ncbi:MAG: extracellular solute-binding protein [Nitrososphaerales archaeon]
MRKWDRRKFVYAGLGAVAVAAVGVATYFATRPPERIVETVVQTQVQTVEKPVERIITQTIERPVEKTIVTTVAGTPTTIVKTEVKREIVEKRVEITKITVAFPIDLFGTSPYAVAWSDWRNTYNDRFAGKYHADAISGLGWPGIMTKILQMVQAGSAPEVSWLGAQRLAPFFKQKALVPLNKWIDALPSDIKKDWESISGVYQRNHMYQGDILALAIGQYPRYYIYRRDILRAIGMDENIDKKPPPKDPDEFLALCEDIKRNSKGINPLNNQPLAPLLVYVGPHSGTALLSIWPLAFYYNNFKNPIYDDPFEKPKLNTPSMVEAFRYWKEVKDRGYLSIEDLTDPDDFTHWARFPQGRWVIHFNSPVIIPGWVRDGLPIKELGVFEAFHPALTNSWDVGMTATTKDPDKQEAAWEFIKWGVFNPDIQLKQQELLYPANLPTLKSVYDKMLAMSNKYPEFRYFEEPALRIATDPKKSFLSQHLYESELEDILTEALQKVLLKDVSPQSALADAESTFYRKYYP